MIEKLIVTGGAGFIGSAVIRHLIANTGARVLNIDKLTYAGNLSSLVEVSQSERYAFMQAGIGDAAAMERALAEFQPDAVMNLAAESHVDRSIDAPADFIETNIVGTYTLLQAARKYWETLKANAKALSAFIISLPMRYTVASARQALFTEATAYDPRSPYSSSKAASDHLVKAWFHTYGLPVVVTNCSNNYGPYQFPEKLIPLVILNALDEKPLPIYGKGDNVRDWLYVDDHAEALVLAVEKGAIGQTYNVGGNSEYTNLQVVEAICTVLDELRPRASGATYKQLIEFVEDRAGHDKRYAIDATKITQHLGWRPRENFPSGIRKTVQWYLQHPEWWQPIRTTRC